MKSETEIIKKYKQLSGSIPQETNACNKLVVLDQVNYKIGVSFHL